MSDVLHVVENRPVSTKGDFLQGRQGHGSKLETPSCEIDLLQFVAGHPDLRSGRPNSHHYRSSRRLSQFSRASFERPSAESGPDGLVVLPGVPSTRSESIRRQESSGKSSVTRQVGRGPRPVLSNFDLVYRERRTSWTYFSMSGGLGDDQVKSPECRSEKILFFCPTDGRFSVEAAGRDRACFRF